jgi:hypothetical protein
MPSSFTTASPSELWHLTMSPEMRDPVAKGILELRETFGSLNVRPTGDGGAYVTVSRIRLPRNLSLRQSWAGFLLPYSYDDVQVYGHFFPAELRHADGRPLDGPGIQGGQVWEGQPAIKVSQNSPRWRSGVDSAALKLVRVLEWLGGRA